MTAVCALLLALAALDPVILENSIDHQWYVAVDGDDTAAGTVSAPFATVQRAQQAVQSALSEDPDQRIVVRLGPGDYFLPDGLQIGVGDSAGRDGSVIYIGDARGGTRLIGGVRVTGWQHLGNNIWQAPIPEGARAANEDDGAAWQLFEDGWRMTLAREPNAGYFMTEGGVEDEERTAFYYRAHDIDPAGWDISDARVAVWPGHDWFRHTKRLVEVDTGARVLRLSNNNGYPMRDEGDRYFVENVPELLDFPGECVFDWDANTVSCIPRGATPPAEREMIIPTAAHVLSLVGDSAMAPVRNIRFESITFMAARSNTVHMEHAVEVEFQRCRILNGGGAGASVSGASLRNSFSRNDIAWNGGHGISLHGAGLEDSPLQSHNRVMDNQIHHNGELIGHGYGVALNSSHNNTIARNHIHHQPRYAITLKGSMFGGRDREVAGAVFAASYAKAFIHTRNNLIEGNHIHHVNLDSQDTGAIEAWGPGIGNVIRANYIHDIGNGLFDLISGIYLDDSASFFTVEHNVIRDIRGTSHNQAIYTKGIGNIIQNNIFFMGDGDMQGIASFEMGNEPARAHHYNRNIHVFEGDARTVYQFDNWSDQRIASCDYNLYVMYGKEPLFEGIPGDDDWSNWRARLDGKYDPHSRIVDELQFAAPDAGDYTFPDDSAAAKLGIDPVDLSRVGPAGSLEPHMQEPLVHVRLEQQGELTAWSDADPATFRLVAEHVFGATWDGVLRTRVWPEGAGEIVGATMLPFRLTHGESAEASFRVRANPSTRYLIVAAHGDGRGIHTPAVPIAPTLLAKRGGPAAEE